MSTDSNDRMPAHGWRSDSIAYVLSSKLPHCFRDRIRATEDGDKVELRMSNGQIFSLAVSEIVSRDSLGRPVKKRAKATA